MPREKQTRWRDEDEETDTLEHYAGEWALCAMIDGRSYVSAWRGTKGAAEKDAVSANDVVAHWLCGAREFKFVTASGFVVIAAGSWFFAMPVKH